VNTKFLNALQPEWSKFVTNVKLAKSLYTTNYDQLCADLSQHEGHAYEACMLRERYQDPLELVANYHTQSNSAHTTSSTTIPTSIPDLTQSYTTIGDDPIACLNKAMAFMSTVVASRTKGSATSLGGHNATVQARVVKCHNFLGEGNMARQCTQPRRPRNYAWFKEKMLLVQEHEAGQVLDEEHLAFLADPKIPDGQAI
ncbi:hypothetical protein Tco_1241857, partial [Tanacetum coccineum]